MFYVLLLWGSVLCSVICIVAVTWCCSLERVIEILFKLQHRNAVELNSRLRGSLGFLVNLVCWSFLGDIHYWTHCTMCCFLWRDFVFLISYMCSRVAQGSAGPLNLLVLCEYIFSGSSTSVILLQLWNMGK